MGFDPSPRRMAGLTGGIASGKSTVARMLAQAGARIVDADRIARRVVQKGTPAWQAIVRQFGPAIQRPDGEIDRSALGAVVFHDAEAKQALNAIVHPRVFEAVQREIRGLAADHPEDLVVLDVPLLIESGWHTWMPIVILVYVPEPVQKMRLMQRDGLNAADAEARIRAQMPIEVKRRMADYIIDNTGDREHTRRQALAVYRRVLAGASPPPRRPGP